MRKLLLAAAAASLVAAPAFARKPTAQERADIEDLAYRYIFALDWRDADTYASTFAPDGVLNYAAARRWAATRFARWSRASASAKWRTWPKATPDRAARMASISSPPW